MHTDYEFAAWAINDFIKEQFSYESSYAHGDVHEKEIVPGCCIIAKFVDNIYKPYNGPAGFTISFAVRKDSFGNDGYPQLIEELIHDWINVNDVDQSLHDSVSANMYFSAYAFFEKEDIVNESYCYVPFGIKELKRSF